jgi:hypothetical protein
VLSVAVMISVAISAQDNDVDREGRKLALRHADAHPKATCRFAAVE